MTINLNRCLAFWAVVLLMLGLYWSAAAHNGAVAIAVPVEGITIDGDLSDWPENLGQYPILRPSYTSRPNAEKFQGSFRIGYNEQDNALFIAVEVHDGTTVIDTSVEAAWHTQDGCAVSVKLVHKDKDPRSISSTR